ncbi:MAG: twin-arginine translocase TatA/TatE family subunit [Bacillota bacterium]
MFGLGPTELVIILVIVLIVLGPKRIPEAGKAIGEGIKEFRSAAKEISESDDENTKEGSQKD